MTQRYQPRQPDRDRALIAQMKQLAKKHPCYGYRFITAKLRQEGWRVNHSRVQRLWRKEDLQVPYRRKTEQCLGSGENACFLKKAEFINHVWTYDFIEDQTEDSRKLKFLTVLDEHTRESLAIEVGCGAASLSNLVCSAVAGGLPGPEYALGIGFLYHAQPSGLSIPLRKAEPGREGSLCTRWKNWKKIIRIVDWRDRTCYNVVKNW
jgi:hypothetical protein